LTPFFNILWLDILILIVIIVGLLLIYKLVMFVIKRAIKSGKLPLEVMNGLKLLLRLIFAVSIIILIITFTELPTEITIAISAIIGTIIGFSSIQALQNFISGMYIIITRPFEINDLVSLGDIEGVVSEISLNYTKLVTATGKRVLISNRNVINSNLVNFTIEAPKNPEDADTTLKLISYVFGGKELTRNAFSIGFSRENPIKLKKVLEEAANTWEPKFGYKPQYQLWELHHLAVYRIILTATEPELILKEKPLFVKDLYRRFYSKE